MRGDGRIYQRGPRWWISFYGPGEGGRSVEHRELGGLTDKEARKKLKNRLHEVHNHRRGIVPFQGARQERVTVEELLKKLEQDYETKGKRSLPQLKSHLKHIRGMFGLDRALGVTEERLSDYITMRQKEKAAPATINRELEGLQAAFSLGVTLKMLAKAVVPTFPSLPEDNAREGFFDRADFQAILKQVKDVDIEDFLDWFFWTGMRPKEIRSLSWSAFDKETWTLRLPARSAKTGYGRVLALEGEMRSNIQRRLARRRLDCPLIFHRKGKPIGEFRKRWKTASDNAGLAGKYRPYDLRRTAVRNMTRAGVNEKVAMAISGHRTRAIFDRYNIVDDRDLRDAVQKTAAYVSTLPTKNKVVSHDQASRAQGF